MPKFGYLGTIPEPLSGSVQSGDIGPNAVTSGNIGSGAAWGSVGPTRIIASGTLAGFDFGSGAIVAGVMGSGSVLSGNIASGQIGTNHLGSGTVGRAANFLMPLASGAAWSMLTGEIISGGMAVKVSHSGFLEIAKASVSGKMPAIGCVFDNVLSGISANVYTAGLFQFASGMADYSGSVGRSVWVGRSGQIVPWSGSWNSGGLVTTSGGDLIQRLGVIANSGGVVLGLSQNVYQNQLLGTIDIIAIENRQFGI